MNARILVKGSALDAVAACMSRGIHADHIKEERESETLLDVTGPASTIVRWYLKDTIPAPEGGYPIGTLLFYRDRN